MSWLFPSKQERLHRVAKRVHKNKSPKVRKHIMKVVVKK
jgi:hypothetical protein